MNKNLIFLLWAGLFTFLLVVTSCRQERQNNYRFVDNPQNNNENLPQPPIAKYTAYVHSDSSKVFESPDMNSAVKGFFNAFDEIQVSGNLNGEMLQIHQPVSGFVERANLYTEDEMQQFARKEIDWHSELNLVCHNKTPIQDIQASPGASPAFGLERNWIEDGKHQVRYIRASGLDILKKANKRAEAIGSLTKNQRIIIDHNYRPRSDWVKVVYPVAGYADKNSLYTSQHVCARLERQTYLVNKINEALGLEPLPVDGDLFVSESRTKPVAQTKTTIKTAPVIRRKTIPPAETGGTKIITWEERQAQIRSGTISLHETSDKTPTRIIPATDPRIEELHREVEALQSEIDELKKNDRGLFRKKEKPEETIEEKSQAIENIVSIEEQPAEELEIDRTTPISIVSPKLIPKEINAGEWDEAADLDKELFAGIDSVVMLSYPQDNKWRITGLGAFAPYHIPVEKNFVKLGMPYGGSIEAGKQNWPLSFGLSYNAMRATTRSLVYILDAKDIGVYAKYTPFKLLKEQLELFVNGGLTGWNVGIMNDKYPEHQDYYRSESAKGVGYMGGAGAMYQFKQFLVGLQYQHYGTPLVVLGPDLNEPETQAELDAFIPTTQYKLYAGSHQFQIILGYRIN